MKKAALLAAAAILYAVAAWTVAPGFYDGFTPPQPYNFAHIPIVSSPNPTSGEISLDVTLGRDGVLNVRIFDLAGNERWAKDYAFPFGKQKLNLNLKSLASGNYIIRLESNGWIGSKSLNLSH